MTGTKVQNLFNQATSAVIFWSGKLIILRLPAASPSSRLRPHLKARREFPWTKPSSSGCWCCVDSCTAAWNYSYSTRRLYAGLHMINMLSPTKKKSVVADEKVDLVGSSHAPDEPMPTRFAPSSRISYWLTLQRWGHRRWEGSWEVESLPDKRANFSLVSTSTLDSPKEFRREICPVSWGGVGGSCINLKLYQDNLASKADTPSKLYHIDLLY